MTFFIPPVFLFGNNANRVPYDEEKKSEYKTAAETEIKVENWRAKRIAELEEENKKLKEYQQRSQSADGEQIERLLGEKIKLEEENKKLKDELSKYKKQYEHSMGEDDGKLTKGGYASFNEYGELMEEDTLQELRDIGEI